MPKVAPSMQHPAEFELFAAALTCEALLPARFEVGERPVMQQQAEALLHGLAVAEDSRGEDVEDRSEVPQSMQRLESKLDLIISLLGKLARQGAEAMPVRALRWSHLGLRLDLDLPQSFDGNVGDVGVLILQPVAWLTDHIELPARILASSLGDDGTQHLWLRFGTLSAGLQDALERHLFRLHRRQVADAKQSALITGGNE